MAGMPGGQTPAQVRDAARETRQLAATVEIVAFSTAGAFLGAPAIRKFERIDTHIDLASKFSGGRAEQIPFGIYCVEGYMAGFAAASRCVGVHESQTFVVLGLPLGGIDFPIDQFKLRGRITGALPPATKQGFAKLVGITSGTSTESRIGQDGTFDFSGLTWGSYALIVSNGRQILASRAVSIPYDGPPLEIGIGTDGLAGHP